MDLKSRVGSHMGWATQAGLVKILIPSGGLALSFMDAGIEAVLMCAELSRLFRPGDSC